MSNKFRKYIVEFIGTFFLVFVIGCASTVSNTNFINAIAIGFTLMVMVYAGGQISGGHYNPAVSIAVVCRGAMPSEQLVPYILSQLAGGIAAGFTVNFLADGPASPSPLGYYIPAMIAGEFLFTFALCYVVLLTATSEKVAGNSYYGLAIGSTVTAGVCAVGGTICMGAFNPAVALAATIMSGCCLTIVLVTMIVNILAGIFAAWIYKLVKEQV